MKFQMTTTVSRDHDGLRYQCPECGEFYTSKNGLKLHVDGIHRKVTNFTCNICGYECLQKGQMNSHIKTVHAEGKDGKLLLELKTAMLPQNRSSASL